MNRLSVLSASILLAYALLPFIKIPERSLTFQFLGVLFFYKINFSTIIFFISAGLAAAGISWLLLDHPNLRRSAPATLGNESNTPHRLSRRELFQHWQLPALTALVIGAPLSTLRVGFQWWAVFGLGGLLLVLVLVAEYIAVDPNDIRYGPAAVGLTAVAYALLLILTIALVASGTRLYLGLPALGGAVFLVTLRSLYLRLNGRWCFSWSLGITLVIGQVSAALHYWPFSALRFGLIILGLAYGLTSVAGSLEEGRPGRTLWIEPAVMLAVLWGLALAIRD